MSNNSPDTDVSDMDYKIPPFLIPATDITRLEPFYNGSGGLGDVWKCSMSVSAKSVKSTKSKESAKSELVAVKSIRIIESNDEALVTKARRAIRKEAYVWILLSHDRILPLKGVTEGFGKLPALVAPWMENGSLNDYLRREHSKLSGHQKLELIQEVAAGLSYLHVDVHEEGIVHGDLTGTNVLVDGSGHIRLADFGLSIILSRADSITFSSCHVGNMRWMAPDVLALDMPTKMGDIYSYGCVALQVFSGHQPYEGLKSVFAVTMAMTQGRAPFAVMNEDGLDERLTSGCFKTAEERLTIQDIMGILGLQ
ncbi:kinase-like domain-containing protein [Suillus clintonianus]|uniref:kinase-like domain-containing protein n=1 Tax=Suillus clintonianus TaxID=1904413 RepID=UPI001B86F5FC|nr:kinase-like domain-containing protein [Suillus clintonianus]KAG2134524.1 kinase-like domain-containing protein [Suillus clintonianus]